MEFSIRYVWPSTSCFRLVLLKKSSSPRLQLHSKLNFEPVTMSYLGPRSAPKQATRQHRGLRTWIFWRVAFNSIVAFHRGIIHLLHKSKKEYLLCQRATTTSKQILPCTSPHNWTITCAHKSFSRLGGSTHPHNNITMKLQLFASAALALLAALPGAVSEVSVHIIWSWIQIYLHHCILYTNQSNPHD